MRNDSRTVSGFAGLRVSGFRDLTGQLANRLTGLPVNLAALLVVVAMGFSLTGCSKSYNGEKLLWKASQLNQPINKDPLNATPEQFAKAITAYELVFKKVPGTSWAARAHLAVGALYAMQDKHVEARVAFDELLQEYSYLSDLALSARLSKAKTYETQQDWEHAVKVYEDIAFFHPWTLLGMESLLYVARGYEGRGELSKAKSLYEQAVRRYIELVADAPHPELETRVKGYLALTYQHMEDWEGAIATFEELRTAPSGIDRAFVLVTLGSIYQVRVNDQDKALLAYSQLVKEFPSHPLAKLAKSQIKMLQGETERIDVSDIPSVVLPNPVGTVVGTP